MYSKIYLMHKVRSDGIVYLYQRIRDLREDKDKTQNDVAKILSISQQHYALYESGKRELPMHHFIALARYYNVSLDYLAGLTNVPDSLDRHEKKKAP